ncbi:MAG TPA: FG-GAP repeat protein [Gammaproteobacteria bacterium]|nr:FG-GAP repeat protein [Gammaproteobacteria bacterium]
MAKLKKTLTSGILLRMIYDNRGIIVKKLLCTFLLLLFTMSTSAQTEWISAVEPNPLTDNGFGDGLANMGKWLVVGDPQDDTNVNNGGAVHVYQDVNGQWQLFQTLHADDAESNDKLGTAVDIEVKHDTGETWIAASAINDDDAGTDKGAVYLFELDVNNTGLFIQQKKLNGGASSANFGISLAMNYDYVEEIDAYLWVLAVGDDYFNRPDPIGGGTHNTGTVFIYKKNAGIGNNLWEEEPIQVSQSFLDSLDFSDRFGASVSVDGIYVLAGTPNYDRHDLGTDGIDVGAVFLLYRSGLTMTWECCTIVTTPTPIRSANFGTDAEVIKQPGNNIIIMGGSPLEKDINNRQIGSVDVWFNGGHVQKLYPPIIAGGAGEHFGASLAANGDEFFGSTKMLVGAPFSEDHKGIVYEYRLNPDYDGMNDFYILNQTIVGTNRTSYPWDFGRFGTNISTDGRSHTASSDSNYIGSHRRVLTQETPIFANGFGSPIQQP